MDERRRVEARCRHGVVDAAALEALGFDRLKLRWWLKARHLERVFKGVYVCTWLPVTWEQRAMRVLAWLGADAALSHRAAASVHGLTTRPGIIEVVVPHRTINHVRLERLSRGFTVHRTRLPFTIVESNDLRVTDVKRTLLDLSGVVDLETLDDSLDAALRAGEPPLADELEQWLSGLRGRAPVERLLALLEERRGLHTDSWLENRVFRALRRRRLRPGHQHDLTDEAGFIMRADFVWLPERVALHVDGWKHHRDRAQFEQDRRKASRLAAIGWTSVWVTARMVEHDQKWLDSLEQVLKERQPQGSLSLGV